MSHREINLFVLYILLPFEASKHKWTYYTMQSIDEIVVFSTGSVYDIIHWVAEPIRKFFPRSKNMGHKKMKKRPELH